MSTFSDLMKSDITKIRTDSQQIFETWRNKDKLTKDIYQYFQLSISNKILTNTHLFNPSENLK